jgi:type II secretory ATPase GspE/PulE/Tfp pilus assembly ATPase PilB-like protein
MVFSTLHTNDSAGAITRLYNLGVEQYLISASLSAVLGQRLVRKLCPHCSETIAPPSNLVTVAERLGQKVDQVFTGAGCGKCRRTGFLGRVGIFEMLVPDDALRDAITSGANLEQLRRLAVDAGMKTLLADGFEKIRQGMTTIEEVLRVTAA